MSDTLTKAQRRRCMSAIRGRDTKPELLVRSLLHKQGLRFRLHAKYLPGKPDIVLPKYKAVIFVHGCFWHSHHCKRGRSTPTTNQAFWKQKRAATVRRDRSVRRRLRSLGWRVIVVWECRPITAALPRPIARLLEAVSTGTRRVPLPGKLPAKTGSRGCPVADGPRPGEQQKQQPRVPAARRRGYPAFASES